MAKKILEFNRDSSKLFITSAAGLTTSNRDGNFFPDNNHEEAASYLDDIFGNYFSGTTFH